MGLHRPQIPARAPMEFHAAVVSEGVGMELRDADATPERLDELPDALTEDAAFDAVTTAGAISDDKERSIRWFGGSLGREVRGEHGARGVGQRLNSLLAPFAYETAKTELEVDIADVEGGHLLPAEAAVGHQGHQGALAGRGTLREDRFDGGPAGHVGQAGFARFSPGSTWTVAPMCA